MLDQAPTSPVFHPVTEGTAPAWVALWSRMIIKGGKDKDLIAYFYAGHYRDLYAIRTLCLEI